MVRHNKTLYFAVLGVRITKCFSDKMTSVGLCKALLSMALSTWLSTILAFFCRLQQWYFQQHMKYFMQPSCKIYIRETLLINLLISIFATAQITFYNNNNNICLIQTRFNRQINILILGVLAIFSFLQMLKSFYVNFCLIRYIGWVGCLTYFSALNPYLMVYMLIKPSCNPVC